MYYHIPYCDYINCYLKFFSFTLFLLIVIFHEDTFRPQGYFKYIHLYNIYQKLLVYNVSKILHVYIKSSTSL